MGIRPSRLASVPVSIETIMADPVITLCHRSSNRGTEQIKSAVKWELSDSVVMCVTTIFDIFLSFLPLGQYNPQLLAKLFQFSAQLINFYLIFFYYLWVFSSSSSSSSNISTKSANAKNWCGLNNIFWWRFLLESNNALTLNGVHSIQLRQTDVSYFTSTRTVSTTRPADSE